MKQTIALFGLVSAVLVVHWLRVGSAWIGTLLIGLFGALMFGDSLKGGVDYASASMRYLYNKASTRLGVSSFAEDELTPAEKQSNIINFRGTHVGGLYNEGNTCFINSVVQSLASCNELTRYTSTNSASKSNFSSHLLQLIHDLNRIRKTSHNYSTNALMSNIGGQERWNRLDQEDAQEFFQELLLALERDWKAVHAAQRDLPAPAPIDSALGPVLTTLPSPSEGEPEKSASGLKGAGKQPQLLTPFDGLHAVRVGCLKCGDMEGIRTGVLSSVDLGLDSSSQGFTLEGLLHDYTHMETISGVECYRCTLLNYRDIIQERLAANPPAALATVFQTRIDEVNDALSAKAIDEKRYSELKASSYKTLGEKTKQTMFTRPLPKVIMIHINRSVFDMRTGFIRKNYAPVKFSVRLDMSEFTVEPEDPYSQDPSHPMRGTPQIPEWYSLRATVIHYGSANFGHYVSFRKFNGLWWRISDDSVDLTTEAQMLNAQGVFMLFYEKETPEETAALEASASDLGASATTVSLPSSGGEAASELGPMSPQNLEMRSPPLSPVAAAADSQADRPDWVPNL